ncbi:MAG: 4Fe-4S dicluster domain-containing protein [Planctomycetota bacterium]
MRWGMVIDLDRCINCQACMVACAAENNMNLGNPEDAAADRIMRWLQFLPEIEGEYPNVTAKLTPMMCQHCEDPPCTFVCPVSATYRIPDGIIAQIYWRCIGCRFCVNACPYTMKWYNWWRPEWPGESARSTNPDVSLRDMGVTEKCCFCSHRLQRAKEEARSQGRSLRPGEYETACVGSCPTSALIFGDLDDEGSEVARKSRDPRAFHFLEELGTKPKVTYLKSRGGLGGMTLRENADGGD